MAERQPQVLVDPVRPEEQPLQEVQTTTEYESYVPVITKLGTLPVERATMGAGGRVGEPPPATQYHA